MTRSELIELVERILRCEGSETEIEKCLEEFAANVPHPNTSNLIYYPKLGADSAEKIVDAALSYKPLITPDSSESNSP